MAQELWIIEASFIANGIRYGFEGDRLREYVEKRLRQSEEFEERGARRQECALRAEFNEKLKEMAERIAVSTYYEEAKRDLLASHGRTPDKACKTLLTDKQRSEECLKPVTGSDPRPTASVQSVATSVGDAQKQLESRPNDVEAQDEEAQDVEAQDVEAQDVEAQDVEAQGVEAQELEAQDLEAQDVEAQEAQELEAQELEAQELEAQELEAQELEAQELEAQELEAQELEAQELEAQDIKAQGVEDKETRRAILVSTEEVSGETVWNTEIRCVSSDSAPAPGRSSVPVTMSCVTAHIVELYDIIGCVLSGPASAPCRSGSVTVSCATAHSGELRDVELSEVVGISDILPWPPPQQQMTRSKPQIV